MYARMNLNQTPEPPRFIAAAWAGMGEDRVFERARERHWHLPVKNCGGYPALRWSPLRYINSGGLSFARNAAERANVYLSGEPGSSPKGHPAAPLSAPARFARAGVYAGISGA